MASDLPVDLLEEILLYLDDAADLARASAACASFRRIVSDGRFLRRFRSLHRRPVLGLLDARRHGDTAFYPAESSSPSPHSSAPAAAAAALAGAADFAFSSLPDPSRWRVLDVRDRRVLLSPCAQGYTFGDLVVYDPVHRRHVQIPAIPGDLLAASGEHVGGQRFDLFLAPAADEDDELSFRLVCNVLYKTMVATFMFASVSGQWRFIASFSDPNPSYIWMNLPAMWVRHYARDNCFYWTSDASTVILVLDMDEMKISTVDLSPECYGESICMGVREGRLGLLLFGNDTFDLYSKALRCDDAVEEEEEWRHDKTIPMPGFRWILIGAVEGYALLRGLPRDQYQIWQSSPEKKPEAHYFIVDLETLITRRLCVLEFDASPYFLYASFPPPFSPPSV